MVTLSYEKKSIPASRFVQNMDGRCWLLTSGCRLWWFV